MPSILIEDIKKIKMIYEINKVDHLQGKGYASLEVGIAPTKEKKDEKYHTAQVTFTFKIYSERNEKKDTSHEDGARLKLIYEVTYKQRSPEEEASERDLVYYLEPYARKEINDMLLEMGIPLGVVPYGLWENEKQK